VKISIGQYLSGKLQSLEVEYLEQRILIDGLSELHEVVKEFSYNGLIHQVAEIHFAATEDPQQQRQSETLSPTGFWSTPSELGLSEGDAIIFRPKTSFAAGVLPFNALYRHNSELRVHLKNEHRGIQAAFLYTEADTQVRDFMDKHLASEIVPLAGDCVVYAPVPTQYEANHESYRDWWTREYRGMRLLDALKKIDLPLRSTENIYKLTRSLRLKPNRLPAVVFFCKSPALNVAVKLNSLSEEYHLVNALRGLFTIANDVNCSEGEDKMRLLKKEIKRYVRKGSRSKSFPITLININLVNVAASFIDRLFG